MENVSIYEKKWLDIVFEGKNKKYGAYQLRQESSKTMFISLLFGSAILTGLVILLSSFSSKEIPVLLNEKPVITVHLKDIIRKAEIEKPKTPENQPQNAAPLSTPTTPITTSTMVVTATIKAQLDIPTNAELPTAPVTENIGTIGSGLPTLNSGNSTATNPNVTATTNAPMRKSELDVQPDFPGGISKFYQFVAENFDKDRDYEDKIIRVNIAFVIEKNGAMTDIKVIENATSDVAKEAIRVLKSLKTKWQAGVKDGIKVRTQFTLPITVQL